MLDSGMAPREGTPQTTVELEVGEATAEFVAKIRAAGSRQEVAVLYSHQLRSALMSTDWPVANQVIRSRWGLAGLEEVKRLAWKRVPRAAD